MIDNGAPAATGTATTTASITASPQCNLTVTPLTLGLGNVDVNSAKALWVALNNSRNADCGITGLAPTGNGDFALGAGTPTTQFTIPPALPQ